MAILISACVLVILSLAISGSNGLAANAYGDLLGNNTKQLWFTQRVDHFDPLNYQTYQQKYYLSLYNWQEGGPIFIFLGGEAPVEFFEFQEVQARQWSVEFGAQYIAIEHRFYGDSLPIPDYSSESLQYLSSQQALADAAYFIQEYIENALGGKSGPWIVFGCSYSGALSAWFRLKYPNLVIGSVAPSGPVMAQTNFDNYYALFQKVADPSCTKAVATAVNQISAMLQSPSGRKTLENAFKMCSPLGTTPESQFYFLITLTDFMGSSDQFQNPPQWPLNQTCAAMTNGTDFVGNWAKLMAPTGGATCVDYNEETGFLEPLRNITNQNRSWFWQKCTEFGFFKPTTGSIFFQELTVQPMIAWCEEIFGIPNMAPNTDWTNTYYGGFNLTSSATMFTNGLFDPWHLLSINSPEGQVNAVTYEAGHCAPMTQPTNMDPPSLTQARNTVHDFLQTLLKNYYMRK